MSIFSKKNDFQLSYKKRQFDSYKSVVDKLDEETKKKLDRQRQKGMVIIVAFVVLLVAILAITGIGVDKNQSASGNVFADKEKVLIECFGDSLTEGYTVDGEGTSSIVETTYPKELREELLRLFTEDGHTYHFQELDVKNFGQSGSLLQNDSFGRLSGSADIVVMQYVANNFLTGEDYVGTIEHNVGNIGQMGACVFLLNYPYADGIPEEDKLAQANNYIASAAKSISCQLIDVHAYFETLTDYAQEDLYSPDMLHLTELGYKLMADYVAQEIHQYYYDMF